MSGDPPKIIMVMINLPFDGLAPILYNYVFSIVPGFKYDAAIFYAEDVETEELFVQHELLVKFENEWKYKIYLPPRDAAIGSRMYYCVNNDCQGFGGRGEAACKDLVDLKIIKSINDLLLWY